MFRLCLVLIAFEATVAAQWLNYPTPGIPRLPDGEPNLAAPAPKAADGKPDLSGVWAINASPDPANDRKPGDVLPWAEALVKQREENLYKDDPLLPATRVSLQFRSHQPSENRSNSGLNRNPWRTPCLQADLPGRT